MDEPLAIVRDKPAKVNIHSARHAVIMALLRHPQLSRSELSEIADVSPAAITDVIQVFLQRGLVIEFPSQSTARRRGRPIMQVELQASYAYFVGVGIAESAMPMVITDLRGQILAQEPLPFCKTPEQLLQAVRFAFSHLLKRTSIPRSRVLGVGITVTGIVDAVEGVCRYSAALNWRDVPIAKLIGKGLRLPAWVENDANAIAVGEKFFGHARTSHNFSTIVLGRTIGAAHYMNEMLYRGDDGSAGEIGHIIMDPGERCADAAERAVWTRSRAVRPCVAWQSRQVSPFAACAIWRYSQCRATQRQQSFCAKQVTLWALRSHP